MRRFFLTFISIFLAFLLMVGYGQVYVSAMGSWNHAGITINKASPHEIDSEINLVAKTTGNIKNAQYKFVWMRNNWKEWGVIRDFTESNTVNWKTSIKGNYEIWSDIKDINGNIKKEKTKITVVNNWNHAGITVNKTSPQGTDTEIVLAAKSTGNIKGAQYKFVWMKNNWKEWGVIRGFTGSNSVKWKPSTEGDYEIWSDIMDSSGNIKRENTKFTISNKWEHAGITINKTSPQGTDTEIVLAAKVTGNIKGAQYKFVWMKNNWKEWGVIRGFTGSNSVKWKPSTEGDYEIWSDIMDSSGNIKRENTKFTISNKWEHAGITINKTSPQGTDTEIVLTAKSTGNIKGVQYKFVWMKNNWKEWGVIRGFTESNSVKWKPSTEGDYEIWSDIMDSSGNIKRENTKFTISNKWEHAGITINKTSPQGTDTEIVLTAKSTGNIKGVQYKFVWMKNNWKEWGVIRGFTESNSVKWKPSTEGDYEIWSDIMDSSGNIKRENTKFTISNKWEHAGITINKTSPQGTDTEIVLAAKVTGNIKGAQYKFVWMKNNWKEWGVIRGFTGSNSVKWKPSTEGDYEIWSDIMDSSGNIKREKTKFTISNKWEHAGIIINKTSPQGTDTEIVLAAKSTGNIKGAQYKFVWMKNNWKEWGVIRGFTESNSVKWKPSTEGDYEIWSDIMDSSGNIKRENTKFTISNKWEHAGITINKTSPQGTDTEIVLAAKVTGNIKGAQYKFVWMKNNWKEWGVIRGFTGSNSVKWKPSTEGDYEIWSDIMDSSGNIKRENTKFTINNKRSYDGVSVSAGKTYCLKASTNSSGKPIYFSTNNSNVATVSNGLVYAVAPGTARITAYDENGSVLRSFTINVLPFEPIRFAYTSPNNASLNSKVNLIAITDKSRDAVKFVVAGKEIMATSKESDGNTYVWTASTIANKAGEFGVKAYSRKSGSWSTCSDADTSMFVNTSSVTTSKVENRRVSDKGINFIAQCEGYVGHVYEDQLAGGILTLGYGKTIAPGETFYNNITQKEAYAMLLRSVNAGSYASSVNKFLCGKGVKYNQRHFDSLVSFTYNLGSRWMSEDKELNDYISKAKGRDLSNVDRDGFSYEILRYHHSGGNHILGLLFRRMDEMRIFFNGNYERHTWRYNPDNFRIPSCIANQW